MNKSNARAVCQVSLLLLFWGWATPGWAIDWEAHRTQMEGRSEEEFMKFVKERAKAAGAENGHKYAEAFRKVTFRT